MRRIRVLTLALSITVPLCAPLAVHADPFPQLPSAAQVSDGDLAGVRGRYVLAPAAHDATRSIVRMPNTVTHDTSALAALPQSGQRSPLAAVPAGGPGMRVAYFGISLVSSWSAGSGANAPGVTVGANIGVDPNSHGVTTSTWSTSTNGGLPAAAGNTGNSVMGTPPLENISGGIGQSIQVAGNGNTVNNSATINIGVSAPGQTAAPTSNTCGSDCTATINGNGVAIAISTQQGIVSQTVGANGVMQSVQIASDLNTITNQMAMQVRLAPVAPLNPSGIVFILQTLNGIR